MFKTATIALAGFALVFTACGSDSSSNSSATLQEQVAKQYKDSFSKLGGITIDEACIDDTAATLPDSDAQTVLDALDANTALPAALSEFETLMGECIAQS